MDRLRGVVGADLAAAASQQAWLEAAVGPSRRSLVSLHEVLVRGRAEAVDRG